MSKRFTATEKWDDAWFRKLPPVQKCLWSYMTDKCDQAGVIDLDFEAASFHIGAKVKEDDMASFAKQAQKMQNGKWLILGFIKFQYGAPSATCKPHAKIFEALDKHGLTYEEIAERLSKGIPKPINGYSIVSERLQEEEEEEEEDRKKTAEPQTNKAQSIDVYEAYPRKQARKDAIKAIEKAAKEVSGGMERLLERTTAYAACVALWPAEDHRFIPHPATWFNRGGYDDDPREWVRGNAALPLALTPEDHTINPLYR